jgi:enamine deaminase RidA (YjgF/YER057c/UK114 family)
MQITRYETGKRMSQAVVAGDLIFLAGQVASDAPGGLSASRRSTRSKM